MNFRKIFILIFLTYICNIPILFANEINIYSHRQPFLINPFLEAFTKETGIKTNVVYATKGLAQRLKAEDNSRCEMCSQLGSMLSDREYQ